SGRAGLSLLRREGEPRVPVLRRALRPRLPGTASARCAPPPSPAAVRRPAGSLGVLAPFETALRRDRHPLRMSVAPLRSSWGGTEDEVSGSVSKEPAAHGGRQPPPPPRSAPR